MSNKKKIKVWASIAIASISLMMLFVYLSWAAPLILTSCVFMISSIMSSCEYIFYLEENRNDSRKNSRKKGKNDY